jgi:PAS domain S-box-containing protein
LFSPGALFIIVLLYLSLLFVLAYYAEKREKSGRSIVSNPYVYTLSFAVYCTSWTFYGSVGRAATSGLSFLTIYLGPTLMAALWWVVLRKMVLIAKENRITTISDLIGARYGRSITLSALVAVVALVGITPYLGLQIKSITNTFSIMVGGVQGSHTAGWSIALIVGVFAIIFGARRLDASERHEGLVFAVAFESLIKLAAFVAVGIFVTYGIFNGFGDIFEKIRVSDYNRLLGMGGAGQTSYTEWGSMLFLSMMAIMFLPRQFQMAVVENSDLRHIKKAMWLFPLYLLLINIFVLPVAFGGLLLGGSVSKADSFVLSVPMGQGKSALALLVFLGGFSAATGMIIVESLALSTMVMNSLLMPALIRFNRLKGFPSLVLNVKRAVILISVFLGYFFATSVGEFYSLVDMGLKSFEAVTLFAPAVLIGLYWKRGNKNGAIAGLAAGFLVWLYTLFIPALIKGGVVPETGLLKWLFESGLGNPTGLFGLTGLDKWSHSLLWSMLVNLVLYFGVSIFTSQTQEEEKQALIFVDSYSPLGGLRGMGVQGGLQGVDEIEGLLGQYIGKDEAKDAVGHFLKRKGIDNKKGVSHEGLLELRDEAEKVLSGALGSATATLILREKLVLTEELESSIKQMSDRLMLSRKRLEEANRELGFLKEFSQNIIESVPQGIATLDREMRVTYWNRGMEEISGKKKAESLGKCIGELQVCLEPDIFSQGIKKGETVCNRKSPRGTLKVTVSPFEDPQGGYVLMVEDITEKLRRESELLQASKYASIGKLTAGVSHEIGNPLASISSLVQEIQTVDSPGFTKEALQIVNQHIERIVRIVRSLGDFARLYSTDKVPTSIKGILESTLDLSRYDKKFRKIEITKEVDDIPDLKINPDQIQQVFLNLILNSLDAMPDGGKLDIKVKRAHGAVLIVFKDTGSGMDRETAGKVFDPFFTTKAPGKGTGLGMSICYGIIKEHGGTITVESEKGHGATFTVRLPVEEG